MAGIWRPYSANLISLKLDLITTEFIAGKESDGRDARCLPFVLCSNHNADICPPRQCGFPSERLACRA